jgi:hypothetical protein
VDDASKLEKPSDDAATLEGVGEDALKLLNSADVVLGGISDEICESSANFVGSVEVGIPLSPLASSPIEFDFNSSPPFENCSPKSGSMQAQLHRHKLPRISLSISKPIKGIKFNNKNF